MPAEHPVTSACIQHLENLRAIVRELGEEAGVHDADSFANAWQMLMLGSIIAAQRGNAQAAVEAKSAGRFLFDQHHEAGLSRR